MEAALEQTHQRACLLRVEGHCKASPYWSYVMLLHGMEPYLPMAPRLAQPYSETGQSAPPVHSGTAAATPTSPPRATVIVLQLTVRCVPQAARVALACGGFLGLDLCLINSTVADARRGCLRMLVQKIMGMCERHRCKIVLRCWKRWCRICVGVQVQEAKRRWRILSKVSAGWRMYCEYIHRVREFTIARRSRKEVSISQVQSAMLLATCT